MNVEIIANGRLFKDVTKTKDVTKDIMNSYGKNPKFQFLRTSSMDNVPQSGSPGKTRNTITVKGREYLEAVERGDMETAQRLVDEAAKKAGLNSPIVYHGTEEVFTSFKPKLYHTAISALSIAMTKVSTRSFAA